MADVKNLTIDQGATFYSNIQYLDINKIPISLLGYDIKAQLRKTYYSANAVTFTSNIVNAPYGNISLTLPANATSNLKVGRYVYDVKANIGNITYRIVEGIVTVNPGVTQ
jgi:hypothetical protein